jgi:hypothetical protein
MESLLDVLDFGLSPDPSTNIHTYRQLFDIKIQADGFYWQVFPLLTAAEAFIFYISVGSGAGNSEVFSKVLVSVVGVAFVTISWISFYINKSKLDLYTKRLFWMEVLCKYPVMHSKNVMAVSDRRFILNSPLYFYWTFFLHFLLFAHIMCILDAVEWDWHGGILVAGLYIYLVLLSFVG